MKINGFDRDPLAPIQHQIVGSEDGVNFFVLGSTTEPLPLLQHHIDVQHAVKQKDMTIKILNQKTGEEEASFEPYVCPERDLTEPPTDEFLAMRERWLNKVMAFLLPSSLFEERENPDKQKTLKRWFRKNRIEICVHPVNGAVRVMRGGAVLTEFGGQG